VVKATVVLAKNYSPCDELVKELQEHVKKVTAPYKYPRIIEFVDELPKTISGKSEEWKSETRTRQKNNNFKITTCKINVYKNVLRKLYFPKDIFINLTEILLAILAIGGNLSCQFLLSLLLPPISYRPEASFVSNELLLSINFVMSSGSSCLWLIFARS